MPERVGDQATMEPPKFERCSILLTFQKLMISEQWTKQPRRDGGRASGPSGERQGGGPATFRLRADHTKLVRAVLFCSLSQLARVGRHAAMVAERGSSAPRTARRCRCDRRDDEPEEVGNLHRSAQAGRSQPRFHVNGKFHLVGLTKNLFAQTSGRKQSGLLAQARCFLIKTLFET